MSRIHTILEKAERDGTLGRLNATGAVDLTAPVAPPLDPDSPPVPLGDNVMVAPAAPPVTRGRWADEDTEAAGAPPSEEPEPLAPVVYSPAHEVAAHTFQETPARTPPQRSVAETFVSPISSPVVPPPVAPDPATSGGSAVAPNGNGQASRLATALVAAREPHALVSEQFRALRTRLTHSINGRGARVLLVTSPGRGEGKSTVAANLALTMGQEIRQRVCLVDAALRYPSLHTLFGLPSSPGLSDVLAGRITLEAALVTLDPYQVSLLPAGTVPSNPAELLGGTDMRRIIALLRSRFDRVVIDGAATAPNADVATMLPLVDGTLLVARAGVTATPAITQSVAAIGQAHVLGVILNDAEA